MSEGMLGAARRRIEGHGRDWDDVQDEFDSPAPMDYMQIERAAHDFASAVTARNRLVRANPKDRYLVAQANERVWESWLPLARATGELTESETAP